MANSEAPKEMYCKVSFYQGLHCLLRQEPSSGTETHHIKFNQQPHKIQNGQFHTYCIRNKKGYNCVMSLE